MSQDEVQVLNAKMDKVLGYLHNDSGTGELGLVAGFNAHKKEFIEHKTEFKDFKHKYEKDQAVRKAKIGVWATIGGAVALFGKWIGGLLIEHIKF